MNIIAAAASADSADVGAIAAMRNAGLGSGALIDVTEIDIEQMQYSGGTYSPLSIRCAGYTTCLNAYNLDGTRSTTTTIAGCRTVPADACAVNAQIVNTGYEPCSGGSTGDSGACPSSTGLAGGIDQCVNGTDRAAYNPNKPLVSVTAHPREFTINGLAPAS